MTQKAIGPTFYGELVAAGVVDWRFSWTAAGVISFDPECASFAAVAAVYAAHDPATLAAAAIDAERDRRLSLGYVDAVTGKTIQTRPGTEDTARLAALGAAAGLAVALAAAPAPSFTIITADNSLVTLSAADTFALLNGRVAPWVSATILHAGALKAALRAGQAIDAAAGWP